jgi:hypothetical protein
MAATALQLNLRAEMELGGTGNLPVPVGHRPNGTERRSDMEPAVRKSPGAPSRSDRRVADRNRRVACATHWRPVAASG